MSLWQSAQVSRTNDSRPSLARDTRNLTQTQAQAVKCYMIIISILYNHHSPTQAAKYHMIIILFESRKGHKIV